MAPEHDPLHPSSRVSRAPHQTSCDLGDERVLLNVETGVYYGLDPVGSRIWELLAVPHTVGRLRELLVEEYDVDDATCERDLRDLLHALSSAGLIQIESDGRAAG